jgi:hypothetical protein
VVFSVDLGGMRVMLRRMQSVTVRNLGMMGGLLGTSRLVMLCRLAVMLGRMLVVLGCLLVVFVDIVAAHDALPGLARIGFFDHCQGE